jgi:ABC-2 type transport system ATP-binding protein
MLAEPAVLLLDEPTAGLDPEGSLLVMDILRAHADAGGSVLLASHHLEEVEQICDRVYLLAAGRRLAHGSLDELLGTEDQYLVVRGLDAAGFSRLGEAVAAGGGEVVRQGRERTHLYALFRSLRPPAARR